MQTSTTSTWLPSKPTSSIRALRRLHSLQRDELKSSHARLAKHSPLFVVQHDTVFVARNPVQEGRCVLPTGVSKPHCPSWEQHVLEQIEDRRVVTGFVQHVAAEDHAGALLAGKSPVEHFTARAWKPID